MNINVPTKTCIDFFLRGGADTPAVSSDIVLIIVVCSFIILKIDHSILNPPWNATVINDLLS